MTPKPQIGNPRPRLFRLTADRAIVNRMGFNNDGADAVAARLQTDFPADPDVDDAPRQPPGAFTPPAVGLGFQQLGSDEVLVLIGVRGDAQTLANASCTMSCA